MAAASDQTLRMLTQQSFTSLASCFLPPTLSLPLFTLLSLVPGTQESKVRANLAYRAGVGRALLAARARKGTPADSKDLLGQLLR